MDLASFAGLAFLLGFKHSYDADHLLAVASFLRKAHSAGSATRMSISWAIGHMATAALVTILLYTFRESALPGFLASFEKIAGAMLIGLGIWSLRDVIFHSHTHKHGEVKHEHAHAHPEKGHVHKHMLGIGIIHGLASNDELLTLFAASLGPASLQGILWGVAVFSLGVVIGMILFALVFSYPLLKPKGAEIYRAITLATAALSMAYGLAMLLGVV